MSNIYHSAVKNRCAAQGVFRLASVLQVAWHIIADPFSNLFLLLLSFGLFFGCLT